MRRFSWAPWTALLVVACSVSAASAQDLVVGAYTPAPVGFNLLTVSGFFSTGGLSFDPTLPVEDASAKLGGGFVGYGRTFRLGGRFASAIFGVPFVKGNLKGLLLGQPQERNLAGFGDPVVRVAVNLYGARAMTPAEFAKYRAHTVVGVSLAVSGPLGQYDSDRYINIGRNRWAFKPELGISSTKGRWTVEGDFSASVFTDNDDYVNGATLEQDPIWAVQGHLMYTIRFGLWVAADANYWAGGRLTNNGAPASQQLANSRAGLTLALPIRKRQVRFAYSFGAFTRLGGDFHSFGASYTYAWK